MAVPNAENAVVYESKVRDYLLNLSHPVGSSKARWFFSIGYTSADVARLIGDLTRIAQESNDFVEEQTEFGLKYIVNGIINSPNGILAKITTVWIVEPSKNEVRFVTAFPDEKAK